MKKIVIGGLQPTNRLHIGNYFGGIKNFIKLQNEYQIYLFIADWHSLSTAKPDYQNINKNGQEMVASFIAAGIDPEKCIFFRQSDVYTHTELMWILTTMTTLGQLDNMTQFKDKANKVTNSNGTEMIPAGLLMYPTLMAADILLYNANFVCVGADQKQHVEFCRNLAIRFNNKFGETFVLPEPMIDEFAGKIYDLQTPTKKMSKTNEEKGTIFLLDEPEIAANKIKSAVTDSLNSFNYDAINQPGLSNLIKIYSLLTEKEIKIIVEEFKNAQNYGVFKKSLCEEVKKFLEHFQRKYFEIVKNKSTISEILSKNETKCIEASKGVLDRVKNKIGIK